MVGLTLNLKYMNKFKLLLLFLFSGLIINAQNCENDTIDPYFVGMVNDITLSCSDELSSIIFPQAFDNCDTLVDIEYVEEQIPGFCPQNVTYIRIYRAYDDSGNESVETQTIYVVDETPPTFDSSYETFVIHCGDEVSPPVPSVTDNCNLTKLIGIDEGGAGDACDFRLNRVWYAYDGCNNVSAFIQTIIYLDDTPPSIIADSYIEVEPDQNLDTVFASIEDACSSVNVNYTDLVLPGGNIIRTYNAYDECGNSSTFTQTIHIGNGNNHVAICHHLGNGNWITIYVAAPAVPAHLGHGDYLGPCDDSIENSMLPGVKLERDINGNIHKIVKLK